MIPIGQLRDFNVAQDIILKLKDEGIECTVVEDKSMKDLFVVCALREEDAHRVHEVYLNALGLGEKKIQPPPTNWQAIWRLPYGPLTIVLLSLSLFCSLFYFIPSLNFGLYQLLIDIPEDIPGRELFSAVRAGEYWRIITPVFVHFGFIHLFFNMLWLKDLGRLVEKLHGTAGALGLFIGAGALSNLSQYLVNGPAFGGMSGVVYAFLGDVFILRQYKITDLTPSKQDFILMVVWFFLCILGIFGPIANVAHGVGLVFGIIFGLISVAYKKQNIFIMKTPLFIFSAILILGVVFGSEYLRSGGKFYVTHPQMEKRV